MSFAPNRGHFSWGACINQGEQLRKQVSMASVLQSLLNQLGLQLRTSWLRRVQGGCASTNVDATGSSVGAVPGRAVTAADVEGVRATIQPVVVSSDGVCCCVQRLTRGCLYQRASDMIAELRRVANPTCVLCL